MSWYPAPETDEEREERKRPEPAQAPAATALKQLIGSAVNYPKTPRSAAWVADVFARIDALAAVGESVQPVQASLSDERYRKLREWYLRGGTRAEIHPFGHIEVTTPEIFDAGVDALASSTPTKET